ncbi:MAG: hybrid sensor histidine kinase/response regulator, partial [Phyllobacterium sp.]
MAGFVILPIALLYFLVQSLTIRAVDRRTDARNNAARPLVYSLSLAASGSSWIYYGSTGYAAQYGIEFAGLYIGIVLAYTVGFRFLLRLVRLAKSEGITSISDFIGARYGKSFSVAALVTIIVTIGLIPYIALQMKAIRQLFDVFSGQFDPLASPAGSGTHLLALSVILGIGLFTVYHSARSSNVTERYDGLIHALAVD